MKYISLFIFLLHSWILFAQELTIKDSIDLYNGFAVTINSQDIKLAEANFERALILSQLDQYKEGEWYALNQLGISSLRQGELDIALEYFQQSLSIVEEMGFLKEKPILLSNMGYIYSTLNDYDKALDLVKEAKDIYIELNDSIQAADMLVNISSIYLNLQNGDSAITYLEQAHQIFEKVDYPKGLIYTLNNLGVYYLDNNQPEISLMYLNQLMEHEYIDTDLIHKGSGLTNIGLAYFALKNYAKAEDNFLKALNIHQMNSHRVMEYTVNKHLAELYEETGEFKKALTYQEEYFMLKDSIIGAENKEKIAELEMQYDLVSGEKALLESNEKVLLLEQQRKTMFWSIGIISLLTGLGILGLIYRNRIKQLKEVEAIRTKIARNLHDDVSNTLNNISIISHLLKNKNLSQQALDEEINRITRLSKEAVTNISDVIWTVNTKKEKMDDLITRLEDITEDYFRPLEIPFKIETGKFNMDKKLDIQTRQNILLIFKEALNNISKHSQPSFVNIKLYNENGQFKMSIQNDHANLSNNINTRTMKIGLTSMKYRAKQLEGEIATKMDGDHFTVTLETKQFA